MLKSLEPFTALLTTLTIGVILLIFRAQVRQLIDWVVRFRRIEKTKEGYAVDALGQPNAEILADEKKEQAIAAVEAVEIATGVADSTPAVEDTWLFAMLDERYSDAVALLENDAETAPNPEQRLNSRSLIGYVGFKQNPSGSVAHFEQLINDYPGKIQPYHWYAMTYLWNDLPEKAIEVIDRALPKVEAKAGLLDTKSDCLARLGRDEDAITAATQGISADSTFVANYLNLARIYERTGSFDLARQWYERALDVSYNAVHVLEPYGRFLSTHGTPAETIQCYRLLLNRQPRNYTYLTLIANAYLAAGFSGLALDAYLQANELANGQAGWILANIGNVYNNQGFHGQACTYLKTAVELEPESQYAHERLAQAQKLEAGERERLGTLLDTSRARKLKPQLPVPSS